MVLIISDDIGSTNDIIDYLLFYNTPFKRITKNCIIEIKSIYLTNNRFEFEILLNNNEKIKSTEIRSVFIRKGQINLNRIKFYNSDNSLLPIYFNVAEENRILKEVIYEILQAKNIIGNLFHQNLNKIKVSHLASKLGLNIAPTLITENKENIESFRKKNKSIVTKSIGEVPLIENSDYKIAFYTSLIKKINCQEIAPSLVQLKIEKLFEIRTFFLFGVTYSMAIFSQNDNQTKLDFRNYNEEKPNRFVPFQLPKEIEEKISTLMTQLNLNTGSIDLIYSTNSLYYFLEINPVGQYGMISYYCNYNLDFEIFKKLTFK